MEKTRRFLGILLSLSMLLVLLTGCGSAAPGGTTTAPATEPAENIEPAAEPAETAEADKYGGILRLNDTDDKAVLGYPAEIGSGTIVRHVAPCIETIMRYDSEGNVVPFLAENVDVDTDALTITLTLKKGIKFHDGTDFNAEAVKWNLEKQMEAGAGGVSYYESVECTDDYTVVIHLKSWSNIIVANLASYAGMMISPTACETNGVDWAKNNPVGTGPFKFVSWEKDVKIVYEKNENYWQEGLPYLDGVEISFTADSTSREFSFRNGDIDVLCQGDMTNLESLSKDGYSIVTNASGAGASGLVPDSADPESPWSDLRVRQAAAYAINGELIVSSILKNIAGQYTNEYSSMNNWAYNPDVVGYAYNVETAKALLAEAGYPDGFTTVLNYNTDSDNADLIAAALQSMLAEVGIQCEMNPVQNPRHQEMERKGGGWDGLFLVGGNPNVDTADQFKTRLYGGPVWYVDMLHSEDYQAAIDKAVTAVEFEDKQAATWEAQRILIDRDCLMIPFYVMCESTVSQDYVHDANISTLLYVVSWTPETAWMDKH